MSVIADDTLKTSQLLRSAGLTDDQADCLARLLYGLELHRKAITSTSGKNG